MRRWRDAGRPRGEVISRMEERVSGERERSRDDAKHLENGLKKKVKYGVEKKSDSQLCVVHYGQKSEEKKERKTVRGERS